MVSRVLGLARDAGMAVLFGAGPLMDAFTVAFRLPNLARRLFGEGAVTAAFLPVFVREHQRDELRGRQLAWAVTAALATVLMVIVAAAELAVLLGLAVAEGPTRRLLELIAILTPYLLFICTAAQLSAVLHALRRFFWPAVLPIILNVFWIAAVVAAPRLHTDADDQLRFICAAITLSGIVQVGTLLAVLRRLRFEWSWDWGKTRDEVREIAAGVLPTVVGLSITQLNAVADSLLAWGLSSSSGVGEAWQFVEPGAATALYLGQRVHQVPLGVFGVALSTVFFPLLADHAQNGRRDALGRDLTRGFQACLVIGLPAAAGLILLADRIPRLLFEYGQFTAGDTALTARMLVGYGCGVWAFMAVPLLNRGFYADGDRTTPMRIGLWVIVVHLALDVVGVLTLGGAGLALATSLAAIVHLAWTTAVVDRRLAALTRTPLVETAVKSAAATAAMAGVCGALILATREADRFAQVVVPVAGSVATYAAMAFTLRLDRIVRNPDAADETKNAPRQTAEGDET